MMIFAGKTWTTQMLLMNADEKKSMNIRIIRVLTCCFLTHPFARLVVKK